MEMPQPGTILDNKYRIEAVIGQGGFGCVYRATERLTGETVAIKELVPSFVRDREMVQRFIQEARATLHLSHPHIARTHTIFEDRGTYYLAMEYLAGGSLAERLRGGPLSVEEAVRIGGHLCEALAYAHRRGVVHCDIKPANVLFDRQGDVRLADFGIAHVSSELMSRQFFTASGRALGTVRYMAPEQLEGMRHDPRVDIYALGAVLYEMLAGRPYVDFETESTPAAQVRNVQRIQTQPPRPLQAINPRVPLWLVEVVERALKKTPEDRFARAGALRDALEGRPGRQPVPVRVSPGRQASGGGRRVSPPEGTAKADRSQPSLQQGRPRDGRSDGLAGWLRGMPALAWLALGLAAAALGVLGIGGAVLLGSGAMGGPASATPTRRPTATPPPPSPTALVATATSASSAPTSTPRDTTEAPAAAPTATPVPPPTDTQPPPPPPADTEPPPPTDTQPPPTKEPAEPTAEATDEPPAPTLPPNRPTPTPRGT
jgi:serine/threonine-protein kinase